MHLMGAAAEVRLLWKMSHQVTESGGHDPIRPAIEPHSAEEARKRQLAAGEHGKEGGRGNEKPCGKRVLPVRDQAAVDLPGKLVSAAKAIREVDPAGWKPPRKRWESFPIFGRKVGMSDHSFEVGIFAEIAKLPNSFR